VTITPELGFWLRHVERSGAAVELGAGTALVLLPEAVRQDFALPEEVVVTGERRSDSAFPLHQRALTTTRKPTVDA
jgi:hypothetical protein